MTAAIRSAWAAKNMRDWGRKRDIAGNSGVIGELTPRLPPGFLSPDTGARTRDYRHSAPHLPGLHLRTHLSNPEGRGHRWRDPKRLGPLVADLVTYGRFTRFWEP